MIAERPKYRVLHELGAGGMGLVWKGYLVGQGGFQRPIVIKQLKHADDPGHVYYLDIRGRGVFLRASPIDVSDIIREMLLATTSERQGRAIDHDQSVSMEKKKQEGYF